MWSCQKKGTVISKKRSNEGTRGCRGKEQGLRWMCIPQALLALKQGLEWEIVFHQSGDSGGHLLFFPIAYMDWCSHSLLVAHCALDPLGSQGLSDVWQVLPCVRKAGFDDWLFSHFQPSASKYPYRFPINVHCAFTSRRAEWGGEEASCLAARQPDHTKLLQHLLGYFFAIYLASLQMWHIFCKE